MAMGQAVRGKREEAYLIHEVPKELVSVLRRHYPKLTNEEVKDYVIDYSD
jgi:hypothetical protein